MDIYIRPLKEEDAKISFNWRNDSDIWKYTGNKPDKYITYEIEKEWINSVLKRKNEIRFAICLLETDEYIGNVQLTNITNNDAEFHIFIGNKKYWGKGIGTKATKLILDFGFNRLNINKVYLYVKQDNIPAIKAYEKNNFSKMETDKKGFIKMIYIKNK